MTDESKHLSMENDSNERESRQWSMFLHLSVLTTYIVPLAGLVAPIVIWQMKKNDSPKLDMHGKIVVNWVLSMILYMIVSVVLSFVIIGLPMLLALVVLNIVFPIIGGIKANNGETWRYPLSIRFMK